MSLRTSCYMLCRVNGGGDAHKTRSPLTTLGGGGLMCPDWLIFYGKTLSLWTFRQHHIIHPTWSSSNGGRVNSMWRGHLTGSKAVRVPDVLSAKASLNSSSRQEQEVVRSPSTTFVGRTTKATRCCCCHPSLWSIFGHFSYTLSRHSAHDGLLCLFIYLCKEYPLPTLELGRRTGQREMEIMYILLNEEGTWLIACPGNAI